MAGFSNYLEDKILDHVVGETAYTMPTAYLALFTAAPTDAGGGTEVSGGSYARVDVSGKFSPASGGSKTTDAEILFPEATASWGTIVAIGLYDASTAGNLLAWANVDVQKTIDTADQARFASGNLTLTLD